MPGVAFDSVISMTVSGFNATTGTATGTNTSGTIMMGAVVATDLQTGATPTITGMTWNGVAMTITDAVNGVQSWSSSKSTEAIYYLLSPATGNHSLAATVSWSGTTGGLEHIFVAGLSYTGNDPSAPIGRVTKDTNGGSTQAFTHSITAVAASSYLVSITGTGAGFLAAGGDAVLESQIDVDTQSAGNNAALFDAAGGGDKAMGESLVSSDWIAIITAEIISQNTPILTRGLPANKRYYTKTFGAGGLRA